MTHNGNVPVLGFAAPSGMGKTTLLVKLLPILRAHRLRVAVVKHAHHDFDIDYPGKDSYALREAGAAQMLVASARRWALMIEHEQETEPALDALLARLDQDSLDLVLVEGFKHAAFPKIELYRAATGTAALYPGDPTVVAIATDGPLPAASNLPVLDLNNPEEIAQFIRHHLLPPRPCACSSPQCCGRNDDD